MFISNTIMNTAQIFIPELKFQLQTTIFNKYGLGAQTYKLYKEL